MKRLLIIVMVMVSISSSAKMRDVLVNEPGVLLYSIDELNIADMVDYYENGQRVATNNLLGGKSYLRELTDRYARIDVSEVMSLQMMMMPVSSKDSVIVVVRTTRVPSADSEVLVYNTQWVQLNTQKYIELPQITDFVTVPITNNELRAQVVSQLDMPFIQCDIDATNGNISVKQDMYNYLGKEAKKAVKDYLSDAPIVYVWKGKKYKRVGK